MPRLKQKPKPFADVRRLLLGYELNGVKLGEAIHASKDTGKRRLDHPEDLTLGELGLLVRYGIPADDLRAAIKFN